MDYKTKNQKVMINKLWTYNNQKEKKHCNMIWKLKMANFFLISKSILTDEIAIQLKSWFKRATQYQYILWS